MLGRWRVGQSWQWALGRGWRAGQLCQCALGPWQLDPVASFDPSFDPSFGLGFGLYCQFFFLPYIYKFFYLELFC